MVNLLKRFWNEEDGMGTIEIVIIIAVLVAVALIFKDTIIAFVTDLMQKLFKAPTIDQTGGSVYNGGGNGGG